MLATQQSTPSRLNQLSSLVGRMDQLINGMDGWCMPYKASILYEIASRPDVSTGLEIGIFCGKSMFPVAMAFKDKGSGKHFGIEPWSNDIAVESETNKENDEWWAKIDLLEIKKKFYMHMMRLDLTAHIGIVESASDVAFSLFSTHRFRGKIDMLHIDGSHSVAEALHDVTNWVKVVRSGGYVVLDDINWPSVQLAHTYLKSLGEEIEYCDNPQYGHFSVVKLK